MRPHHEEEGKMTPEDKQRIYDAGYKQGQENTHAEIRSHFYEKGDTGCEPCLTIAAVKGVQVRFTFTGEVSDECAEGVYKAMRAAGDDGAAQDLLERLKACQDPPEAPTPPHAASTAPLGPEVV